jgi:hypothetical protein
MTRVSTVVGPALLLALLIVAPGLGAKPATQSKPFPVANVRFEQNATDGDVEVVFEVTGRSEGLAKLTIDSPDGRTVVAFNAPDDSTLGIRQFVFESPEPKDVAALKAAYPEGKYEFAGQTASGAELHGTARLSHALPATTSFVSPPPDARGVAVKDLKIVWQPVPEVAGYVIEIEQDELEVNITARLPGSAKSFDVPEGFLRPRTEYQLGIGTVSVDGNISYIETTFTTAAE